MVADERHKNYQNYFIFVVLTAEYLVQFICYFVALFQMLYNGSVNDTEEITQYFLGS